MSPQPIVELLYKDSAFRVGSFRCPPSYPNFSRAGQITGYVLAFARSSVTIQHEGHAPVVADPNVVMLYNPGQPYRRGKLSERGDITDWIAFKPHLVRDAVAAHDPGVLDREQQLFAFTHGPASAEIYLLQHMLLEHTRRLGWDDRLFVEEMVQNILAGVISQAYEVRQQRREPVRVATARAHRNLAHEVKALLAREYARALSLEEIASAVYASPYHLARVFRQQTGLTIHNYRNQIRLRHSLDQLQDDPDLSRLALELGYNSHSHFTNAFRQTFGITPSSMRGVTTKQALREMSKILQV